MSKKNINTKPFKYSIGERVKTKTGEIEIIQQLRLPYSPNKNINGKFYKYRCCKDGYEDIIYESSLNKKVGCKVCGKSRLVVGYNDIATILPEKIKAIANIEDAYNNTISSNKCIDFKCEKCGCIIAHKPISTTLKKEVILCPICDISTCSFGERFMWSLLYFNNIKFWHDCSFKWSNGKRYDFYLPDFSLIIEMNGEQHYLKPFNKNKTVMDEQANDFYKQQLAKNNGIEYYYQFDCKENNINIVIERILATDFLMKINLTEVDWLLIKNNVCNPIDKQCLSLWNSGTKSTIKIGKILSIDCSTVRNILKKYSQIGECDYDANKARKLSYSNPKERHYANTKSVICLDNLYIFERMAYASEWCGSKKIYKCCKGKALSAGRDPVTHSKLHWQYLNNYLSEHSEITDTELFIKQHLYYN